MKTHCKRGHPRTPENLHGTQCKICRNMLRRESKASNRNYMKYADHKKEHSSRIVQETKQTIHRLLGGKCARCGFDDPRALQIDHKYGDGAAERRLTGAGRRMYVYILKQVGLGSDRYQLLCANCNWIKRFENDEQRKRLDYSYVHQDAS